MVEENGVVKILAEQFARARHVVRDVQEIAVEAFGKPDVAARVVVEQENANRTARCGDIVEAEPAQQSSQNTHLFYESTLRKYIKRP